MLGLQAFQQGSSRNTRKLKEEARNNNLKWLFWEGIYFGQTGPAYVADVEEMKNMVSNTTKACFQIENVFKRCPFTLYDNDKARWLLCIPSFLVEVHIIGDTFVFIYLIVPIRKHIKWWDPLRHNFSAFFFHVFYSSVWTGFNILRHITSSNSTSSWTYSDLCGQWLQLWIQASGR